MNVIKNITIDKVKTNMVIASSLYDENGKVLLKTNKQINKDCLNKLKYLKYSRIFIYDNKSNKKIKESIFSENYRLKRLESLYVFDIDSCFYFANQILEKTRNKCTLIDDLIKHDISTYLHSINVTIYSIIIGIGLGLSNKELYELAQGALLHDIGKINVSKNILNKNGKLNAKEFEQIKNHPKHGLDIIKNKHNLFYLVENAIYSHHENEDGSGYPRNLKSEDIHIYAKIIHIADVYDALTSKRTYKDAFSSNFALEYMKNNSKIMFDEKILNIFIKYISNISFID